MLHPFFSSHQVEAGCDEAGRGCLAGPVVAAAVILPRDTIHSFYQELNDSKQLSEKQREKLAPVIKEHAVAWGIALADHREIDKINILNASFLAMHRAVDKLTVQPEMLLIDGNRFKRYKNIPHQCIVKGDAKYLSIAAASILAKTFRDEWMLKLHEQFPHYCWHENKGYPTKKHRDAIQRIGTSPFHRLSFRMVPKLKD